MTRPPVPDVLARLRLPVIAAPLFIVSSPQLVVAQCQAGIVGAIPALNARTTAQLDQWLGEITAALADHDRAHPGQSAGPLAVNLIAHRSNTRLEADLAVLAKHRVPIVITSMGARTDINDAVHGWGGIVLHDVITDGFARKAIDKGADGLIAVAAGAGGHAGTRSPFALVQEIRAWFNGPLALSGAIATGRSILAARAMGADFAYIGSAFIATHEAQASSAYRQMLVDGSSDDIVYTDLFSGVHANYLKPSVRAQGLDPDQLAGLPRGAIDATGSKAWRDIWGAGQGIAAIHEVVPAATLVDRLTREYAQAAQALAETPQT